MAFTSYRGIFEPADLEILQKVFEQLCKERRLALEDGDQRERLACEVIAAFENGFTDEAELWRSLSTRRTARRELDATLFKLTQPGRPVP